MARERPGKLTIVNFQPSSTRALPPVGRQNQQEVVALDNGLDCTAVSTGDRVILGEVTHVQVGSHRIRSPSTYPPETAVSVRDRSCTVGCVRDAGLPVNQRGSAVSGSDR